MSKILLLFPLLLMFVSCGTKTETDPLSSAQLKLIKYLPYSTEYLFYINISQLKNSNYLFEKFVPEVTDDSSNSWIKKFENDTGINLRNGINSILMAVAENNNSVFIVKFDDNIKNGNDYFKRSSLFIKKEFGNKEIFLLKENPSAEIYFPENSILLFSNNTSLMKALVFNEGKNLTDNSEFLSVIKNIKNKKNLWMATDRGAFSAGLFDRLAGKDSKLLSPKILSSVSNLSVSADFAEDINVESALECTSTGNAYLLASAVEGAIAMNVLSTKDEKLGKIFDKMDVKREGKLIRFHLSLSAEELNDLKLITKYNNQVNKF